MQYSDPELGVQITRAESDRFGAPLLLVHGLWADAWVWSRMTGYLGHRGWESWALERHASGSRVLDRCATVGRTMPAAPVIVGHDLGAAVALRVAAALEAPALVLIAPVLPGRASRRLAFGGLSRTMAALLGRDLAPPGDRAGALFADCADPTGLELIRTGLVDEPGHEVHDLLKGRMRVDELGTVPPTLVIGGAGDRLVPEGVISGTARELGGDSVILEGGHWLPVESTWQSTCNCLHRWLVRTLGESFLLMREDWAEAEHEEADGPD
jgi:pimeloyl-ACP methyl ester carboxylesterase